MLGLGAGLGFGVVEVSVRLIDSLAPSDLLANPATYALLLGGGAAFLSLTSALQRGSVTTATAAMVIGETIGPAAVGVVWLGDRTREGMAWVAVLGFLVAVAGALALARFGEAPPQTPQTPQTPETPQTEETQETPQTSETPQTPQTQEVPPHEAPPGKTPPPAGPGVSPGSTRRSRN